MHEADTPQSCAVVMKSGNLNLLETSGPLQACNGTDLPLHPKETLARCIDPLSGLWVLTSFWDTWGELYGQRFDPWPVCINMPVYQWIFPPRLFLVTDYFSSIFLSVTKLCFSRFGVPETSDLFYISTEFSYRFLSSSALVFQTCSTVWLNHLFPVRLIYRFPVFR